jgi:hypothetical protein
MRVRYYGFLANRHRHDKLAWIRRLLGQTEPIHAMPANVGDCVDTQEQELLDSFHLCPECRKGRLRVVAQLPAKPVCFLASWSFDSS